MGRLKNDFERLCHFFEILYKGNRGSKIKDPVPSKQVLPKRQESHRPTFVALDF